MRHVCSRKAEQIVCVGDYISHGINKRETRTMEQIMRGDKQSKLAFCECGKLHFTYGSVSLHFDRDEFLMFADSVGRLGAIVRQAAQDSICVSGPVQNANVCH
jgi:hypothetical protein